ncbi:MAG: tripartite tricarboxylate transporter substrate binding protein [Ideonella sp.]|nr:tripartite tricarboxylate transporter substrate binding protein [Ideonella sp.]MBL0147646.1 tripartite tricarboxylate transporter substrate binding protein [Ideonella sp.]
MSLHTRRHLLATTVVAALCADPLMPAAAQSDKPVKLLVGYAAGGPVDAMARIFAPMFAKELGQPVVVENKPGASGALAGELTVGAAPDGLTLFFAASPTITIVPHIQKKMRYDPNRDLMAVVPLLSYANVLVVNKDNPARTLEDLLGQARANPGKVFYGSAGVGASNHLSGELLATQAKVKLVHVPYKGNAPAMNDVMGGQLTMMFDIVGGARKYITAGQVRALAVTSAQRNPMLPEVPTMRESGLPAYEVGGWYGLYAPPRLPATMATRLADATHRVQASPEMQARMADLGYTTWVGTGEQLAAQARKELELWGTVSKGIEIE